MTCDRCQFWVTKDDRLPVDDADAGWGLCALTSSDDGLPNIPDAVAYAIDGDQYWAILKCWRHFGCSLFDPRKDAS